MSFRDFDLFVDVSVRSSGEIQWRKIPENILKVSILRTATLQQYLITKFYYSREMVKNKAKKPTADDAVYNFEVILDKRENRKKFEYFIKWQGYSSDHNSWEPEENIPQDAIEEYNSIMMHEGEYFEYLGNQKQN
jgi:Chromo (CHRromatin Organisation MOdifier) domain